MLRPGQRPQVGRGPVLRLEPPGQQNLVALPGSPLPDLPTINVTSDAERAAAVNLRWKDDSGTQKQNFTNGYALRLEFGAMAKGKLPGKIYLCAPDAEKSYLMGSFNAGISKPKPKK